MINTRFFSPRNIVAIALITTISHFVARPLYNRVARKGE